MAAVSTDVKMTYVSTVQQKENEEEKETDKSKRTANSSRQIKVK